MNAARGLFKRCFKNPIFSLVPFEIWRDILSEGERDVIARISQTCWGFKGLVDNLRELILEYALKYRREDKIEMAKNLILRCADIGNSRAMFHVGYALWSNGGWGLNHDEKSGVEWMRKSAQLGNGAGMAFYVFFLLRGLGCLKDREFKSVLADVAFSSKDSFGVGYCYFQGLGTKEDHERAFEYFKASAEEGNEYGQDWFGYCFENSLGVERDYAKAFYWYLKSAEQGFAGSQRTVGWMYSVGDGCEKNEALSKIWLQKAANQGLKIMY